MGKALRPLAGNDDVPGIFAKLKRTPLKIAGRRLTEAEQVVADKAFDSLCSIPPWREWFDSLGPQLEAAAKSDDANIRKVAQRGLHIWQCIEADLAQPVRKRRPGEWYVEWAMRLGGKSPRRICGRWMASPRSGASRFAGPPRCGSARLNWQPKIGMATTRSPNKARVGAQQYPTAAEDVALGF